MWRRSAASCLRALPCVTLEIKTAGHKGALSDEINMNLHHQHFSLLYLQRRFSFLLTTFVIVSIIGLNLKKRNNKSFALLFLSVQPGRLRKSISEWKCNLVIIRWRQVISSKRTLWHHCVSCWHAVHWLKGSDLCEQRDQLIGSVLAERRLLLGWLPAGNVKTVTLSVQTEILSFIQNKQ